MQTGGFMGLCRCTGIYSSIYVTSAKGHIIYPCPLLLLAIRNKCVLEAGDRPLQFVRYGCLSAIGGCVGIIDVAAYAPVKGDRCTLPPLSRSPIHQLLIIMCTFTTKGLRFNGSFHSLCFYCRPAHGLPVIFK